MKKIALLLMLIMLAFACPVSGETLSETMAGMNNFSIKHNFMMDANYIVLKMDLTASEKIDLWDNIAAIPMNLDIDEYGNRIIKLIEDAL